MLFSVPCRRHSLVGETKILLQCITMATIKYHILKYNKWKHYNKIAFWPDLHLFSQVGEYLYSCWIFWEQKSFCYFDSWWTLLEVHDDGWKIGYWAAYCFVLDDLVTHSVGHFVHQSMIRRLETIDIMLCWKLCNEIISRKRDYSGMNCVLWCNIMSEDQMHN